MCDQYDEDLNKNLFFKELSINHSDLLKKACDEYWIICVPRDGTIEPNELTIDTILDHILVENYDENQSIYYTLSKRQLIIDNKILKSIDNNKKSHNKSTRILFEETFYLNKTSKYIVWCIDSPLFFNRHQYKTTLILETLKDCYDYLWNINLGYTIEKIQELCELFVEKHQQFPFEDLQTQKELLGNLYSQCLQITLKNTNLINSDSKQVENIKLAVETLMQHYLNVFLIKSINTLTIEDDNYFNRIVRTSSGLQIEDLGISSKHYDTIISAKYELNKLNTSCTILDKINCLKLMYTKIKAETTNDLLQILIFIIIKLHINNWLSNLVYLTKYRYSTTNFSDKTEFLLTNLEAAIEFIKSREFSTIQQRNFETNLSTYHKLHSSSLDDLKQLFIDSSCDNIELCHPLCTCETCKNTQRSSKGQIINEKGQNLLIFSTIINRQDFVEFLQDKFDINSRDYYGRTSLHYACYYGYQNLVLLLLYIDNINLNIHDNDGNTALHLAVSNCNENCVKALLYTIKTLDINSVNKNGDTPLHLAIKWSYYHLVYVLLENRVNPLIVNKRNQLAINLSSNYLIENLYKQFNINYKQSQELLQLSYNSNNVNNNYGVKPRNLDELKKIDLLLKAIENNDVPLTRYYLGFPATSPICYDFNTKCHPLCNCNNCSNSINNDQVIVDQSSSQSKLNVNLCNSDGYTALHIAAKYGRLDILRLLLDLNALINVKSYKHLYSPLHLACIYQRMIIVKELVKCGDCLIDCQDYRGNTPLYYACINNNLKIIEILLNNGADYKIQNYYGSTIINEIENRCLFSVQKLLKNWYVDSDSNNELF